MSRRRAKATTSPSVTRPERSTLGKAGEPFRWRPGETVLGPPRVGRQPIAEPMAGVSPMSRKPSPAPKTAMTMRRALSDPALLGDVLAGEVDGPLGKVSHSSGG